MRDGAPQFPPLLSGLAVGSGVDPFAKAVSQAMLGCDSGLVTYEEPGAELSWALVLAPEAPLREAMSMVLAAGVAMSDALGALGPPETAVHLEWPGTLRVNGARVGEIRAAASPRAPAADAGWLVIGLRIALAPRTDRAPGLDPDRTTFVEEGCGEIGGMPLLESWSRHMLVWINRWLDEGTQPLHRDWTGRAHRFGEEATVMGQSGTRLGLDEHGGLLLRQGSETRLLALSDMLELS